MEIHIETYCDGFQIYIQKDGKIYQYYWSHDDAPGEDLDEFFKGVFPEANVTTEDIY